MSILVNNNLIKFIDLSIFCSKINYIYFNTELISVIIYNLTYSNIDIYYCTSFINHSKTIKNDILNQ
jgi:hypothetical protein